MAEEPPQIIQPKIQPQTDTSVGSRPSIRSKSDDWAGKAKKAVVAEVETHKVQYQDLGVGAVGQVLIGVGMAGEYNPNESKLIFTGIKLLGGAMMFFATCRSLQDFAKKEVIPRLEGRVDNETTPDINTEDIDDSG